MSIYIVLNLFDGRVKCITSDFLSDHILDILWSKFVLTLDLIIVALQPGYGMLWNVSNTSLHESLATNGRWKRRWLITVNVNLQWGMDEVCLCIYYFLVMLLLCKCVSKKCKSKQAIHYYFLFLSYNVGNLFSYQI